MFNDVKASPVRGMCQYWVWVQTPDTSKNTHMCLSVHLFEKLGQCGKSYYWKKKIQWGALQLTWTTVILLIATDLCWLTPAEDLISLENWCNFFHSYSKVSILSWGSTPTSRSPGAEFALNLKSSHTEGYWIMCHLIFTDPQGFPSSMGVGFMYFLL